VTQPRSHSVLIVIDSLQCGGAERHVVDLARRLCTGGHSITIACSVSGRFAVDVQAAGAEVLSLCPRLVKRRFSLGFARGIRHLLQANRFDLVHAHLYASSISAAAAAIGTGVPLVVTEQTEGLWRSSAQRAASAFAYRHADRVIGVSRAITQSLTADFGLPEWKVAYVPNGVDLSANGAADGAGLPDPVVGLVARLVPEKDVPSFLHCAQRVLARFPGATFPIAGDGPLRTSLIRLARELGIESAVSFLGVQDDMEHFFSRLDVLAVSSAAEGTPLAIVEAMGIGVPVVATAVGGIPDQIDHGVNGLLVPPGDPRALAEAVTSLLEDEVRARTLAAAARDRALSEFSIDATVTAIEDIYAATLADHVPAKRAGLAPANEMT